MKDYRKDLTASVARGFVTSYHKSYGKEKIAFDIELAARSGNTEITFWSLSYKEFSEIKRMVEKNGFVVDTPDLCCKKQSSLFITVSWK